jgi:hypothetical protein
VELCEAVTVTVLLASCASEGAAGIKSKTMTRRRDINRFYSLGHVRSFNVAKPLGLGTPNHAIRFIASSLAASLAEGLGTLCS